MKLIGKGLWQLSTRTRSMVFYTAEQARSCPEIDLEQSHRCHLDDTNRCKDIARDQRLSLADDFESLPLETLERIIQKFKSFGKMRKNPMNTSYHISYRNDEEHYNIFYQEFNEVSDQVGIGRFVVYVKNEQDSYVFQTAPDSTKISYDEGILSFISYNDHSSVVPPEKRQKKANEILLGAL